MELSVVLWNCKGWNVTNTLTDTARCKSCESTMESWKQQRVVPTVVLAQEVEGEVRNKWITFSSAHSNGDQRKIACFFPERDKTSIPNVEFLSTGRDLQQNEVDVACIQSAIMTIGSEKILICSWQGPHAGQNKKKKKKALQNMLKFVDKIKVEKGCCAALIGGDFNLKSRSAKEVMLRPDTIWPDKPTNAVLYDCYEKPSFREDLNDYVIAWPCNKISQNSCKVIDTVPRQPKVKEHRVFEHALIRYNFTVRLEGKWEGDGEVTWYGECGEGKVTLEYCIKPFARVEVKGVVSGQWEGSAMVGHCRNFERVEITGICHMRVYITNEWVDVKKNKVRTVMQDKADEVWWIGCGKVKWESAGEIEVSIEGDGRQIVEWNGTGSVKWKGKGKASWIGGKLEKWKGNQTVTWADDHRVQWAGAGEVELEGGEVIDLRNDDNWTQDDEEGRKWRALEETKCTELEWKGRGVTWKVKGEGTGKML